MATQTIRTEPTTAAAATATDVLVANGAGFEAGLEETIHGAEDDGTAVFEAIDHVASLQASEDAPAEEDEHADEEGEGDEAHEGVDAHFFNDPARMATAINPAIAVAAFLHLPWVIAAMLSRSRLSCRC